MRIPDGDLVPARRRAYGGGYARRRLHRTRRFALVLVPLLAIGGAAYWYASPGHSSPVTLAPCPTASPTPAPLAPAQVRLALLNGTARNGLAAEVATALQARGFVVISHGNAPALLAGPSQVLFGTGADQAAALLARHVPGARVVAQSAVGAGVVRLVLGSTFVRLATPAEVAAATPTGAAPAAVPSASPAACAA